MYCRLCALYLGELSLKKNCTSKIRGGPAICCQAYKAGYSVVQLNVDAFQVLQDVHTKLGAAHSDFLGKGKHIKPRKLWGSWATCACMGWDGIGWGYHLPPVYMIK